jgi:hypothetical protein
MISEDHWRTHHRGMRKPSELYSKVSRDENLDFFRVESSSPQTYWCWGMKINSLRKWFSSQGQHDEQFRLEPMRSTTWLSSDHEGKLSLCHLPLLFRILFEWNNTWLWHKRWLSSTNCHNGSRKGHFWITCRLRTVSCLIGTRVVIRSEGRFFTRILTIELQQDGSWDKIGHMGNNCPTTWQDVNSSNGFCPKQGFNSWCNKPTFLLIVNNW